MATVILPSLVLLRLIARRLLFAVAIVFLTAVAAFGGLRALRPSLYGGEGIVAGTLDDLERAFLHFDFGAAQLVPGGKPVADVWRSGVAADLYLLAGALVIAVVAGVGLGMWCAVRPGTRRARALETVATVLYCTPIPVLGMGLLLLFNDTFGRLPVPAFFDALPGRPSPAQPKEFVELYLVPWLILAAPFAGMLLRATVPAVREEMTSHHVRTAFAKGLRNIRVVGLHAGPAASATTVSFAGASIPLFVSNAILVEHIFSVQGFFRYAWRATGHTTENSPDGMLYDFPLLQGVAIWAAVLTVLLILLSDVILALLDPRVHSGASSPAI